MLLLSWTQALIGPIGHCVGREVANSQRNSNIDTTRARQAHYLKWYEANEIFDPVGSDDGWQIVLAIYGKFVMKGINYMNKQNMRSDTVKGYVLDAGMFFALRDFINPVDFDNEDNWSNIIVSNLKQEKNIATQRSPLTNKICAELFIMADVAHDNSVEALVYNVLALARIIGP